MIFPSVYAIVVRAGMIGQWTFSYVSGQIPELESESIRIRFHLAAEFATAVALIVGGLGLLTRQSWGSWSICYRWACCCTQSLSALGTLHRKGSGRLWCFSQLC